MKGWEPYEHVTVHEEDVALRKPSCTFRHRRDPAGTVLSAFYGTTRDMYIGAEGKGCVISVDRTQCAA